MLADLLSRGREQMTLTKGNAPYSQNITMRCANNTLQVRVNMGSPGSSNITWQDLVIAKQPTWQSSFGFNFYPNAAVEPFAHSVNGTRQPGVFLGVGDSTTWFFKYNWGGNAGEYYLLRLLGRDGSSSKRKRQQFPTPDDRDYTGFLKVVG